MKPAPGPGREPSRCAMCGWEGDLEEVPFRRPAVGIEDVFGGEPDPMRRMSVRCVRGLDEAAAESVWKAVGREVGGGLAEESGPRSRIRYFASSVPDEVAARLRKLPGVERVSVEDGSGTWSRWIQGDLGFLRVRLEGADGKARSTASRAVRDAAIGDLERFSEAKNGDLLLALMGPPSPGLVAALRAVPGVSRVIVPDPAPPDVRGG